MSLYELSQNRSIRNCSLSLLLAVHFPRSNKILVQWESELYSLKAQYLPGLMQLYFTAEV